MGKIEFMEQKTRADKKMEMERLVWVWLTTEFIAPRILASMRRSDVISTFSGGENAYAYFD